MARSRRQFLSSAAAGTLGVVAATAAPGATPESADAGTISSAAPPAFGTAPATGPEVTAATFAEAEKLVQVTLTVQERAQAASNWRQSMAA